MKHAADSQPEGEPTPKRARRAELSPFERLPVQLIGYIMDFLGVVDSVKRFPTKVNGVTVDCFKIYPGEGRDVHNPSRVGVLSTVVASKTCHAKWAIANASHFFWCTWYRSHVPLWVEPGLAVHFVHARGISYRQMLLNTRVIEHPQLTEKRRSLEAHYTEYDGTFKESYEKGWRYKRVCQIRRLLNTLPAQ